MRFTKEQQSPSHPVLRFLFLAILLIFLFMVTESTAQDSSHTVSVAWTNSGVPTLVGPNGHTLYTFARDKDGESTCENACAENWPPLLIDANTTVTKDTAVVGVISSIQRSDGQIQLSYNGWPLYYYHEDLAPGDDFGHGVRDVWFAANPADIMLSSNGSYLVGAGGFTLYIFTEDEGNESYCLDECTIEWHPVIAAQDSVSSLGEGLTGELDAFQRSDGQIQLSYNGWPLYFFNGDEAPGDITGDGEKDIWFVADIDRPALEVEFEPVPATPTTVAPTGSTPEPTTEATIEATSELTPEVTPETTPELTPEVTPELTPEVTPETTAAP